MDDRLENAPRLRGKRAEGDFFVCPDQDPCAQAIGLNERLHEAHLIDADSEEEAREFSKRLLAESSASIEIIPACAIAVRQKTLVVHDIASQPPSNRPDRSGIEEGKEHGV